MRFWLWHMVWNGPAWTRTREQPIMSPTVAFVSNGQKRCSSAQTPPKRPETAAVRAVVSERLRAPEPASLHEIRRSRQGASGPGSWGSNPCPAASSPGCDGRGRGTRTGWPRPVVVVHVRAGDRARAAGLRPWSVICSRAVASASEDRRRRPLRPIPRDLGLRLARFARRRPRAWRAPRRRSVAGQDCRRARACARGRSRRRG